MNFFLGGVMSSKNWICLVITLSVMIALGGCVPKQTKTAQQPVTTVVRTETEIITPVVTGRSMMKSNVREVASSRSNIVDVIPKGTQVELTGKNGNWYRVKRLDGTGTPGFVYHKLITLDFGNYLGTRGQNKEQAIVYNSPSRADATALKLAPRTGFDIIGFENGYYKIRGEYFEGYLDSLVCVADPTTPIAKSRTVTVTSPAQPSAKASASTSQKSATKSGSSSDPMAGFFGMFNSTPKKKTETASKSTATTKKNKTSFRSSTKKSTKVKKQKSGTPSAGEALIGSIFTALLTPQASSNNAVPVQSENDAYKQILKSLDTGKELAKQTVEIREQMLTALNETRALQGLVGATVAAMNSNYKLAAETARGVNTTGMKKISIKAFIKDLSYEPTDSIESASVKIAQNGKMLKTLETQIKTEADSFSQLNSQQLQNMDSIIGSFSTNLHASNALYDFSIDKSSNVITGIDRALQAYDAKAGQLAVEATKQAGIIALATTELVGLISNAQNNPIGALTALPRMIEVQQELTTLTGLFSDFQADYDYIENNSALISQQGKEISRIIMTARRKNTQVTTILESYFKNKMALSSRLKSKLSQQAEAGYKDVEKKASSVALGEDLLD